MSHPSQPKQSPLRAKQWQRPELVRLGKIADVAQQKNSAKIQGNFS